MRPLACCFKMMSSEAGGTGFWLAGERVRTMEFVFPRSLPPARTNNGRDGWRPRQPWWNFRATHQSDRFMRTSLGPLPPPPPPPEAMSAGRVREAPPPPRQGQFLSLASRPGPTVCVQVAWLRGAPATRARIFNHSQRLGPSQSATCKEAGGQRKPVRSLASLCPRGAPGRPVGEQKPVRGARPIPSRVATLASALARRPALARWHKLVHLAPEGRPSARASGRKAPPPSELPSAVAEERQRHQMSPGLGTLKQGCRQSATRGERVCRALISAARGGTKVGSRNPWTQSLCRSIDRTSAAPIGSGKLKQLVAHLHESDPTSCVTTTRSTVAVYSGYPARVRLVTLVHFVDERELSICNEAPVVAVAETQKSHL